MEAYIPSGNAATWERMSRGARGQVKVRGTWAEVPGSRGDALLEIRGIEAVAHLAHLVQLAQEGAQAGLFRGAEAAEQSLLGIHQSSDRGVNTSQPCRRHCGPRFPRGQPHPP